MDSDATRLIGGLLARFVSAQAGTWNHDQWLGLLASVRAAGFTQMSNDEIGRLLEQTQDETRHPSGDGEHTYDVALSFAGEDRVYVEEVARLLQADDISTFYDRFEQDALWGKDLYVHLDNVYRRASRFCVMFISAAYAAKLWTGHERRSIQAKDFISNAAGDILPARFDDTEVPGLRPQMAYVDLRHTSPAQLAGLIASKVRGRHAEMFRNALTSALASAESYLAPQQLATADEIASEIRLAFRRSGYAPTKELLLPVYFV